MTFKSIFKSNIDTYHRASPCRPTRRLITAIVDFFILVAVSLVLYVATFNIVTNIDGYKEAEAKVAQEVEYYKDYISETHLVEYGSSEGGDIYRIDTEETALKILLRNLKFSYEKGPKNEFFEEYDVEEKLKDYPATTLQNDNILYFLGVYLPEHNVDNSILDMQGMSPTEYYTWALGKSAGDTFFKAHYNVDEVTGIPYIKPYIANKIIGYVFYDTEVTDAQTYYSDLWNVYIYVLNDLESVMLNNNDYKVNHYAVYEESKREQALYITVSFVINLFVSYFIAIVLPQILFKDGRTFARKIFNVGVISRNLGEVKRYQILGRCVFGFFGSFPSLYLIPLLPFFNFQFYTFNIPFFVSGDFYINLGHFILAFGILAAINALIIPILKKRTSLIDLATQCYVVDGRHLDEIDYEEPHYPGK